jgi:hypothetical protein
MPAGDTGANFSLFKDPIVSPDTGLAFQATVKGDSVQGDAAQTIWWRRPATEPLLLLAQGGARPGPDLPADAQWKTFTSLAIASRRGPLFVGSMVVGKGGITEATANGVWANDFTGVPRLIIQTGVPGAILPGKTLQSFALLKATAGTAGVTRSFNNCGDVFWVATFTDETSAIVHTVLP